ncbi:hypothetical protein BRC87_11625 [Halobacteriales archaeon QS_4_66_20]|nr:MAG: hypothetical protein BRC87_11625 [Halobacteriales archaeon QS_4_66_20]
MVTLAGFLIDGEVGGSPVWVDWKGPPARSILGDVSTAASGASEERSEPQVVEPAGAFNSSVS